MNKRTKIVCTMGPACDDDDILREMIRAGMNVARFNFSHGSHAEQHERMERVKRISTSTTWSSRARSMRAAPS